MKNLLAKTIEYGIYLLVFILPWQTRWIISAGQYRGGAVEYWTYSLYLSDLVLLALLLLQSARLIAGRGGKAAKRPLLWLFIGAFELVAFISVFNALDRELALFAYARLLLAIGAFYLMANAEYRTAGALAALGASGAGQSLLGVWQFFSGSASANKWLGLAAHEPSELGASVIEAFGAGGSERWLRAYGGLDHPNILGGFLAAAIIALAYLRLANKAPSALAAVAAALLPFCAFGLVFSFSRSAWLGAIAGLALMIAVALRRRDLRGQQVLAGTLLALGLAFFAAYLMLPQLFSARISGGTRLEDISARERLDAISEAQAISAAYPGLGTGIGNYTKALAETVRPASHYRLQPVHNTFLLVKSELGIAGLLLFLMIILYCARIVSKSKQQAFLAGMIGLAVCLLMFDHWLWSLHFGLIFGAVISGLIIKTVYSKG